MSQESSNSEIPSPEGEFQRKNSKTKGIQKSQVLECSENLKNEVLSNLEGIDFWCPGSQKVNPPLLCNVTDLQQGGIP